MNKAGSTTRADLLAVLGHPDPARLDMILEAYSRRMRQREKSEFVSDARRKLLTIAKQIDRFNSALSASTRRLQDIEGYHREDELLARTQICLKRMATRYRTARNRIPAGGGPSKMYDLLNGSPLAQLAGDLLALGYEQRAKLTEGQTVNAYGLALQLIGKDAANKADQRIPREAFAWYRKSHRAQSLPARPPRVAPL